jgi:hypothetical protein
MRLWSIHPKYLDQKGLVACWREALGAKAALDGVVQGYKNHPQLDRFKQMENQSAQINAYLYFLFKDSQDRKYNFDSSKIDFGKTTIAKEMCVTRGQFEFELNHLFSKLEVRDPNKLKRLKSVAKFDPHPLFRITPGDIESWEKI